MKLPRILGRAETPEPPTSKPTIDASRPRECYLQTFAGHPSPCPRCGATLYQSYATFMVGTKRGRQFADTFMIGADFGWFCSNCPTVVINPAHVGKYLTYSMPGWDTGPEFVVLGIVDLDAIPPEKQHLALGEDDNPIPLVEFTRVNGQQSSVRSARQPGISTSKHPGSKRRTAKTRKNR